MKFDLRETARDHKIIAAHRGSAAGNIPCNTLPAYEAALMQGADMIETDLNRTKDGKLIIFHPKMEQCHLGRDVCVDTMSWSEVKELRYQNYDCTETQFGILSFDELLETFKGRCYINIDKFWSYPGEIYETIKAHDMVDQVLVKSEITADVIRVLEDVAPELPFMSIVREEHPWHEELLRRNINYVGVDGLYKRDDSYLASTEFMEQLHHDGQLVWGNAIIYDHLKQLSGGHSDDSALTVSPEYGWGWFADRPFDVIQTDWTGMLVNFLKNTGRYYR